MTAPEVVHFFSYATGVSLELPVGFELVDESDGSASYADRPEGEGPITESTPVVRVRLVGEVEGPVEADAVRGLADGFAAAGGEQISRTRHEIDECPAVTVVSRDGGRVLHQTAVVADGRLLSIVAVAPGEQMLPVYDTALESIRFIAL
jgi:hypothetical protein